MPAVPEDHAPDTPELSPLGRSICHQILQHAANGHFGDGGRLTEIGLSHKLGVSRTPVRAALRYLHTLAVVEPVQPKGYRLCATAAHLRRMQRSLPQDPASTLYHQLLRDRTSGSLPGLVTEALIEQRYAVRRAVVREVLLRMLQEGLLGRRHRNRWEFAESLDSAASERESYGFRLMIECNALLEVGYSVDQPRLEACRARQQALLMHATRRSWNEFFNANAELHELLASGSGNRFVVRAVQEQNRLRRAADISDYLLLDLEMLRASCREHLEILDAVAFGRMQQASQLMRNHLLRASDVVEKRVAGLLDGEA